MEPLTQELRQFIIDNFLFGEESEAFSFSDEDSLLELAIIDSTGILELVAFLEQRYGIAIADDELAPGNLDSVSRLTTFVQRKLLPAMR